MLAPNFNKTYEGSQGGPSTGSNLTIGETGRFKLAVTLPAGKINDLVIIDNLPAGLTYLKYEILNNLNINLPACVFTHIGNLLTFSFPGTTTTTNGQNSFFINLDFIVANNNTNNHPHSKPTKNNIATMNWNNPGSTALTGNSSVTIVEPNLEVIKKFNPNTGSGGKTVTLTLTVKNTGDSTAYNVLITDPLTSSYNVFDLDSVTSYNQNGFIYSYPSNIVTFTGGNIAPGQNLTFTFNVTVLNNVFVGPTFNNTAYANYYSLLNGLIPDTNSRNYTDSGWAIFRAGDPTINKVVLNSTIHSNNGNLAIGEHVIYRITVIVPKGQATNLTLNDILPAGFGYVLSTVTSDTWNGQLADLITSITGTTSSGFNVTFLFNGLTTSNIDNNMFYIDLEAVVQNVTGNTVGSTKTNNVNLTWNENSQGPFKSSANNKIVGPTITILKSVTPSVVDGGDKMKLSLLVTNTGSSPAFEIRLTDILNTTLFDLTTFSYTPVPGHTFLLSGNTLQIIGNPGIFINNTGTNFVTFNFTLNSNVNVPSNSTFNNRVTAIYYSMPSSFPETRSTTATSNLVNIKTVSPSITKVVDSTSEPDSQGNNVMIGEVVVYKFNLTIPHGKTLNVSLKDILPSNLQYNSGTLMIKRSSDNISATGFNFNLPSGQYELFTGTVNPLLTINLGNITFTGTEGLENGTVTLIFNTTVLNNNLNQNGTQILNNVTFNYANASGTTQARTAAGPTLNVIVPHLSTTKNTSPQNVEGGQNVKFTIKVSNDNTSNGASAYNLEVLDQFVDYINLNNIIITPSDASIVYIDMSTSSLLHILITKLNPGQYLNITYNASVRTNITYGQKVNNTIKFTGTSLPGDHGTDDATPGNPGNSDGKRTGDPTLPAGAVNNLISSSTATVTVRNPTISKNVNGTKNIKRTIGDSAYENLVILLPVGTTNNLNIMDVIPTGLQVGSITYSLSNGISVNQFIVNQTGNTYTFDFGNIKAANGGNITISYLVTVQNITSNVNGNNLTNNAALFYQNITGGNVNAGSDTATIQVVEPNLVINKTASKNNLKVGEIFTYTLYIKHYDTSTADAYNVLISDTLPMGLSYISGSAVLPSNWILTIVGNTLNFKTSLLTLSDNNSTITFDCIVNNDITLAGQNITNTANMNYTSTTDGGRAYNQSSSSHVHIIGVDLQVKKTGTSNVHAGQGISYTVTITNIGPDAANNVIFKDNFIASWFNQLVNPRYSINGGSYMQIINNPWTLSLGDISSGNSIVINIIATVSPSSGIGIINNTATANSDTTDPNPNNNNDTKLTNVDVLANLSISKTGQSTVVAGHSMSYSVVVVNNGPSDAQDVLFKDVVPVLSGVIWSLNGVNMGSWTGVYDLGVMAPGEVNTLVFTGLVPSSTLNGTVINNTAFVTSPTDPESHNSTSITDVNTLANLTIKKTANSIILPGKTINYQIFIKNNGSSDAQNVYLTDSINARITNPQYSLTGDPGSWMPWIGYLELGTITSGNNLTVYLMGTLSQTANHDIINTATVTSPTDPEEKNSTVVTHLKIADLGVIKNTSNSKPNYLKNVKFTITCHNYGPDQATGVLVKDLLPTGLKLISFNVSQGSYDLNTGIWTIGTINTGKSAFLNILDHVTKTGNMTNTATKIGENEYDPNTTNNQDSKTIQVPQAADLSITKTVKPSKPQIDHTVDFTITVKNHGPNPALEVYVLDKLPKGLKFISASTNYGQYDPISGNWTIGTIPMGSVAVLNINAITTQIGNIENHAAVYSLTYDPTSNNTTATAVVDVQKNNNHHGNGNHTHEHTIPMKDTGVPLSSLLLAMLLLVLGLVVPKRK